MSAFLLYLKNIIFFYISAVNIWFGTLVSVHPSCKQLREVCECAFSTGAEGKAEGLQCRPSDI